MLRVEENPMPVLPNLNDESSSSDEEFNYIDHITAPRRVRVYRNRRNHFEQWDEGEFYQRFRLSKAASYLVLHHIKDKIQLPTTRNKALTPSLMLLLTLRFLATNSFLISVGDFVGIHKSTAGKYIWRVLQVISKLRNVFIKMPTNDTMHAIQRGFYAIAKFPNVIGAIDCTHVKIESPGGSQAETYRCRKQFFSVNVQAVCTSELVIEDIVARWPGSAHDSRIFQNSAVKDRFESGEFGNGILLADSGYAVTPYCLTPLPVTNTRAQELYNEAQIRTRNPVERMFGVMKRRFPVLSLGIRLALAKVQFIVVVCAILHNIAIITNDGEPPQVDDHVEQAILLGNNIPIEPVNRNGQIDRRLVPYVNYFETQRIRTNNFAH